MDRPRGRQSPAQSELDTAVLDEAGWTLPTIAKEFNIKPATARKYRNAGRVELKRRRHEAARREAKAQGTLMEIDPSVDKASARAHSKLRSIVEVWCRGAGVSLREHRPLQRLEFPDGTALWAALVARTEVNENVRHGWSIRDDRYDELVTHPCAFIITQDEGRLFGTWARRAERTPLGPGWHLLGAAGRWPLDRLLDPSDAQEAPSAAQERLPGSTLGSTIGS
jgi:hypothetical protein